MSKLLLILLVVSCAQRQYTQRIKYQSKSYKDFIVVNSSINRNELMVKTKKEYPVEYDITHGFLVKNITKKNKDFKISSPFVNINNTAQAINCYFDKGEKLTRNLKNEGMAIIHCKFRLAATGNNQLLTKDTITEVTFKLNGQKVVAEHLVYIEDFRR